MDESQAHIFEFGNFCIDGPKRLLLKSGGEIVPLMPKAFDTLLYLIEHPGKVIEKEELMSAIWADTIVEENNLTQNISILRRVLGDKHGENRFIATVPGHGYKFVADVRKIDPTESSSPRLATDGSYRGSKQGNEDQRSKITGRMNKRLGIPALAVLSVLVLGSLALYLWRGSAKSDAPIKTIAVLVFKSLLAENRNEALEMGMADTLINKLSNGEIIVRPLSSVRRYNSLEQDPLLAGRELGVDSILEGSIQTTGERIRISARLIRTSDGKQLWTGQFDENFTDIFEVQDLISERVLAALTLKLNGDEQKRLTKRYTENVEAYQLYMKGRFHASNLILPEAKKGVEYFQQAITIDPNYALAYVGLAQAYCAFSLSGDIPANEAMPKAKAAATRAIELDDTLAESQVAVGQIAFWYDWNWKEAEKRYQRALELDPDNPAAIFNYAHLNSNLGRHNEAVTMGKRARELDPLSPIVNSAEGQFFFFAGRSDEALSRLRITLELYPNFWHTHLILSMVYTQKGMFDEALTAADKATQISGGNSEAMAMKGYALAKSGRETEARAMLGELLNLQKQRYVAPYNISTIYNALGETNTALDYLEKAYAEKNVLMVFLKVDPKWNNLRNDPSSRGLLSRMGE